MFKFSDNRKTVNEIFTMFDEGKLIVDDTISDVLFGVKKIKCA